MISYLKLLRILNCLIASFGVLAGSLIVFFYNKFNFSFEYFLTILLAMFAVFLITGAGNSINDYVDVDSDRINKPNRPIPSGRISRNSALYFSLFLFLMGILLSGFINWVCFFIALFNSFLLIIYSFNLQNKAFLGNVVVSYLVGSTFLFGGAALGSLSLPLILMVLAFFSNLSREIVKDLEDIEGDRNHFFKRFVSGIKISIAERFKLTKSGIKMRYGVKKSLLFAELSLLIAVFLSPMPYFLKILGLGYLLLLIPTDLIFLYCVLKLTKSRKKKDFTHVSKTIKIGMVFALLAFILGVLV